METFTDIFSESLIRKGSLTSCEEELRELMRQIDLMVSAKKAEWETHVHAVQIQLDKKTKEVEFVKVQLEQKCQEIGGLQQKVDEMDITQRDLVAEYEEHVMHLKQEEYRAEMHELEGGKKARDDRIRGLESQKKALIEKSDLMQLLGYQAQLNKRRQMMEDLERDHQQEMAALHSQLGRAKGECDDSEDTAAEDDQRQHSEDMSKMEESLIMKDEIIRQLEEVGKRTENIEVRRLKEDLRTSRMEIQSHLDASQYQKDELSHLNQKLENSKNEISKLQAELCRKQEEVKFIQDNDMPSSLLVVYVNLFILRDSAMASITERAQRMEKELRETAAKHDRAAAELQVTNAQLEALRIENRHLRDTALNDQLTDLSDLYSGNLQLIGQLEDDNRNLRTEVATLREELTTLEAKYQDKYRNALKKNQDVLADIKDNEFRRHSELQSESERKVASLEGRLEATIRKYETQLHSLQMENERLKSEASEHRDSGVPHPLMSSTSKVLPEYVPRRPVDLSHTSTTSGYTDTEALTYADLTAGPGPSDTEENRREKELERILDRRIADLKTNTEYILQKYT
ncbi:hypothetical protein pdam_00000979 [Pocillopora damicornis]|uniref:CEP63/Deup1 N-terminal domain-containing protein n=1 Tax=Pocillopora damicornis TaxID=46731 RepID=A0A3M6T6F3_POCDA|nr:hypothetical protein pdam_00000979 [Pocillopora damicornis]